MPKRRNSARTSKSMVTAYELNTHRRRSPRLLNRNFRDLNTDDLKPTNNLKNCTRKPPREPKKSNGRSLISEIQVIGSRRSLRLSNRADGISNLRRSSRLSLLGNSSSHDGSKKSGDINSMKLKHSSSVKSTDDKGILLQKSCDIQSKKFKYSASVKSSNTKGDSSNKVKWKDDLGSCDESVPKSERRTRCRANVSVVVGIEAVTRKDVCQRNQETRVIRKRKRGEEVNKESVKGWTREQEMALQRAYILAKPTPNFWKQVAKLVPGKSAKDCFDKIHSDHITPPQPLPRSRPKKINSSPLGSFSLSASKLLGSTSVKAKRFSWNKQKSHVAQKTVRQLLQKHNRMDLNFEGDLFSILEPNVSPSGQDSEPNNVVSMPKQLQEKQGFFQKCHEMSFCGQKKTLSRLRSSNVTDLFSPPVLKQVKNRALHEKYIDQLHCREAKRKAACARAGKESNGQANIPKTDIVGAAKNALVSDAIDAINKLQHLQTNPDGDSSHCDSDVDNDDDDDYVSDGV